MAFGFSAADQRKWMEDNRPEVQAHVDAPLVAYGACFRTGSYGGMAAMQVSGLAGLLTSMAGKKKAGGLPQNFLLAVTGTKVHAFKYRPKGFAIKVGDEVAVWERSAIVTSAERTSMTTRVTLESPSEGERIVFDTGKLGISDDLLDALGCPVAA